MSSVTIELEKDLEERLAEEAEERGVAAADIARLALLEWLTARKPSTPKERYERVKHLIGKFAIGPPDAARRHDEYLSQSLQHDQEDTP